ncbi:hypothetical protein [Brenneria roseae]|uniref:hypothetical protein n=1 Tax=Brenneria roseae TaxID=1509241 RepID=UPI001446101D|nr:hypothetical protein [Brenneria roseae]
MLYRIGRAGERKRRRIGAPRQAVYDSVVGEGLPSQPFDIHPFRGSTRLPRDEAYA